MKKLFAFLTPKLKAPRLVIAETKSSTWTYHLRSVIPGDEKYSGGAGPALCRAELGWDTRRPVSSYGKKASHIPERFCEDCAEIARAKQISGYEILPLTTLGRVARE